MSSLTAPVHLALGDDFLTAFSRLPKDTQKKTRHFIDKFRENPDSPGLNYEKIRDSANDSVRSVRVDQNYRAILLKPEKGNTFVLLWVDKHDDAYDWAKGRVCSINPRTGTLQVYQVAKDAPEPTPPPPEELFTEKTAKVAKGIFDPYTNAELLSLGLPEEFLSRVRGLQSDADLNAIEDELPPEAFEALLFLEVEGSLEATKRELGIEDESDIDPEDLGAALKRQSSQRHFVLITDEKEMEQVLNYPLERWRIFLHPSQRRLVKMQANGPVRVLGGAGTGKTVVAMHRAKWLAETSCQKGEKILLTTFTKNLTADILANLRMLCSLETLEKIEVVNLDALAARILSSARSSSPRPDFTGAKTQDLWQDALSSHSHGTELSDEQVRREWDYVVQPQGIRNLPDYVRASRIGMGTRLSRPQRKELWPIFEEYFTLMKEAFVCEPIDVIRQARQLLEEQKHPLHYRAVIVDEAQDFSAEAFKLIRAIIPPIKAELGNDLFIVGDGHQRLYGHRVVLGHCGINIRGRGKRLRINYRTSEETRRWAVSLLEGCSIDDLDGGEDSQQGYRSLFHGEEPVISPAADENGQTVIITEHIDGLVNQGASVSSICIVARKNSQLQPIADWLAAKDHPTHKLEREGDQPNVPGIRLATMHRVKGIEFDHLIVSHLDESSWKRFLEKDKSLPVSERSLIYVAATRARKSLFLTSAGKMLAAIDS